MAVKKIKVNAEYWQKRAEYNFEHQEEMQKEYFNKVEKMYAQMEKQLEAELSRVYAKYAKNNVITNEEAYKSLSKSEMLNYKSDVFKWLGLARQENKTPEHTKYLINETLKHKVNVIDQVKTNWRQIVADYSNPKEGEEFLGNVYAQSALASEFDIDKAVGMQVKFNNVNEDKIQRVVEETWSGGNYFSRYWDDKDKLVNALDNILVTGFATGQSYSKMAQKIADATGKSKGRAMTLVRTECARLDNEALLDNLKDIQTNKFQFSATLDNKTSDICSAMDGQIFDISEAEIGVNVPPLHPNCRSTIIPYEDIDDITERVERNDEGKSENIKVGSGYNYADWAENKYGKSVADSIRNNTSIIRGVIDGLKATTASKVVSIPNTTQNIEQQSTEVNSDERRALIKYTGTDNYKTINEALREGYTLSESTMKLINDLDSALKKLPVYEGMVKRSVNINGDALKNFLNSIEVGEVAQFNEYLSTSMDYTYNLNAKVQMNIQSKNGRDITKYNAMENEVLFQRGSMFNILDIHEEEGYYIITMEEIL